MLHLARVAALVLSESQLLVLFEPFPDRGDEHRPVTYKPLRIVHQLTQR